MTIWVRHPSGISRAIPGIIKIRCWSLLFYRCSPNGNQGIFNSTGETVKPYVAAVGTVYSNTKTVIKSHKSWAKVHFINSYIIRTASNGKRIGRNNQQHSYAMRKAGTYIKLRLCKHEIKINVINYYCPIIIIKFKWIICICMVVWYWKNNNWCWTVIELYKYYYTLIT